MWLLSSQAHFASVGPILDDILTRPVDGVRVAVFGWSGEVIDGLVGAAFDGSMSEANVFARHHGLVLVGAIVVPLVAAAVLSAFRDQVENTNAALVLVLIVVAAASTGIRSAGIVAALSSAIWFDFFLTAPYLHLTITDRADIETTILLVLVGAGVTEVALWGRREQARSSRYEGFLAGVMEAAAAVAGGEVSAEALIERVERQLVDLLSLDACVFQRTISRDLPQLRSDGSVFRDGRVVDVDHAGLPTDSQIQLLAQSAGAAKGEFLLTASAHVARPALQARLVAVALADQVGAALAGSDPTSAST